MRKLIINNNVNDLFMTRNEVYCSETTLKKLRKDKSYEITEKNKQIYIKQIPKTKKEFDKELKKEFKKK